MPKLELTFMKCSKDINKSPCGRLGYHKACLNLAELIFAKRWITIIARPAETKSKLRSSEGIGEIWKLFQQHASPSGIKEDDIQRKEEIIPTFLRKRVLGWFWLYETSPPER